MEWGTAFPGCGPAAAALTSMDWAMSYRVTGMMGWGFLTWSLGAGMVLLLATLASSRGACRRFWCQQAGRVVDVEFEEHGVPGLRRFIAVRRCSAFEPATAMTCRRPCLHRAATLPEARLP